MEPMRPSHIKDEVAYRTQWSPAVPGGTNFKTRRLVEINPDRMEYRPATGNILFCLLFLGIGLLAFLGLGVFWYLKGFFLNAYMLLPVVFGSVFIFFGGAFLYRDMVPIVFDRTRGFFMKGNKKSPLEDIHALQLIQEECHSGGSDMYTIAQFFSYEVNIVFQDGHRINVIDHGDLEQIRHEVKTLSHFMGKPLWDAVGNNSDGRHENRAVH